ncbi:MAG TPA: acyl-CoA thioesterase [Chroococcidiopsis sp.]
MEKIVLELPVHAFNIDYNGHVNNAVYHQWMEIGVTRFFETIGLPLTALRQQGVAPVLAETRITYRQPIYYGESVRLEMWLSKLSGIYCMMEFRFFKPDQAIAAIGQQKGVFINRATARPARLSTDQHHQFARFLHPEPPAPSSSPALAAPVALTHHDPA